MVGDPVGDFIVRLTNAGSIGKVSVSLPYSQLKHAVADTLVAAGYLKSATKKGKKVKKTLDVELAYEGKVSRIRGVKRISKPGRRLYTRVSDIKKVKFGTGALVLSTPNGILTDKEAKEQNVGGEQLFQIW